MGVQYVFIGGAPRCGTSSLHAWLGAHPEVKASSPKESRFFLDKNHPLLPERNFHNQGFGGFRALFGQFNGKVLVESTPDYLYARTPFEVFPELNPKPHVVFLLRKPSERILSTYKWFSNNAGKLPPGLSFRQFVNDTKKKKLHLSWLDVIEQSKYDNFLPAWYDALGEGHVHVVWFEQLIKEPARFLKQLSSDIGINPEFWDSYDFPAINHAMKIKNYKLHRFLQKPYRILPKSFRKLVKPRYYAFNSVPFESPSKDELAVMKELDREFD